MACSPTTASPEIGTAVHKIDAPLLLNIVKIWCVSTFVGGILAVLSSHELRLTCPGSAFPDLSLPEKTP